jgi:hypothetical protein
MMAAFLGPMHPEYASEISEKLALWFSSFECSKLSQFPEA